jgi:hypothetical protein
MDVCSAVPRWQSRPQAGQQSLVRVALVWLKTALIWQGRTGQKVSLRSDTTSFSPSTTTTHNFILCTVNSNRASSRRSALAPFPSRKVRNASKKTHKTPKSLHPTRSHCPAHSAVATAPPSSIRSTRRTSIGVLTPLATLCRVY